MIKIVHKNCGHELKITDLQNEFCPGCSQPLDKTNVGCKAGDKQPTSDERAYYTNQFIDTTEAIVKHVRGIKTSDYGETWKRLGLMGIYVKLFIKEGRLNELIWKKGCEQVASKDESIKDTLLDMAAYAIYGMICLEEDNIQGEAAIEEHLLAMRAAINERLECNKFGFKAVSAYKVICNKCGNTFLSEDMDIYCDKCKGGAKHGVQE